MKKRHPNHQRVKIHRSYSVEEIANLFGIHKITVRRWLKGLVCSDMDLGLPQGMRHLIKQAISGGEGWPDVTTWRDVDRFPDSAAKDELQNAFDHLDTLTPELVEAHPDEVLPNLRFCPEALEVFRDWRAELGHRLLSKRLHPAIESHLAKYRKLVPNLALAWSEVLESHAIRMYQSAVLPDIHTAKAILAKIIDGSITSPFSSRDVWRPQWAGLTDSADVRAGLNVLVEYDYLGVIYEKTSGRTRTTYTLNPKVKS